MISAVILSALLPAAGDLIKGLVGKITGGEGAKPTNVAEIIQLREQDIKDKDADARRLEALSKLDQAENVHQWVNDVRALQRPVVIACVLLSWVVAINDPDVSPEKLELISSLAGSVFFFLFGERAYMYIKKQK